jgi:phosphatidate cytidylyltransferase
MSKPNWRLSDLTLRLLAAAILIPLVLLVVFYGSVLLFWLILCLVSLMTLYEFYRLLEVKGVNCLTWLGLSLGLLINVACLLDRPAVLIAATSLAVLASLVSSIWPKRALTLVLPGVAGMLLGLFYIPWLMNYLLYIRRLPQGRGLLLLLFLLTWVCDSAAYFVGRSFGRHKLMPSVSPAKTVEGMGGGLFFTVLVALLARAWFPALSIIEAGFLGLGLGIVAQVGDLCESRIKRWAQVKDTGSLIPGHGGLLDRLDSLIFATPFFYYCAKFMLEGISN